MSFEGKTVCITGAGSGIGRSASLFFARRGANVFTLDINEFVHDTAETSPSVIPLLGDAGNEADIVRLVSEAKDTTGRFDIMVANAGISGGIAGLFELTAADWVETLRINLIGAFLCVQHAANAMIEAGNGGAIICTASVAGLRSGAGGMAYSASKAGVISLVQTSAQQLVGSGIRINAICPGLIETGMTKFVFDGARERGKESQIGKLNPLQRGGSPDEIASAIGFLASEGASYINGQSIPIDGGLSSSHPIARMPRLGQTAF
jgi:NAD(P)-dependent dehydrogenase (short-subunit alcohol dehydrogenase family)